MKRSRVGHRWLAPEAVQSSAMDCGPAALKCLLEGFGIPVSYDRLREACQTGLDGTSIDTLEQVAVRLGLDAEQIMLPPDHLFVPEAGALPALVVVANPLGVTHFVVIWRRHGRWLQVMDPASGRRWMSRAAFDSEIYRHRMRVPAAAWRAWAGSDEAVTTLDARLRGLAVLGVARRRLLRGALDDPSWVTLASLDAAVRLGAALAAAGALRRGREIAALVERCVTRPEQPLLGRYQMVEPVDSGEDELWLSGAVLVRVRGCLGAAEGALEGSSETGGGSEPELPPELAAAVARPSSRPGRQLLSLVAAEGARTPAVVIVGLAAASAAVVVEALLFRGLLDLGGRLATPGQRIAAGALLVAFLFMVAALELALTAGTLRIGRKLETRLRHGLLSKIPRLGDRYFASRLSSDMAERCHSVHKLRLSAELAANALRSGFQLVLTAAGIAWLDPRAGPLAALSAALAVALPLAWQPALAERDLRMRSHAGALGRFYLDALLGLMPLRSHVAETPVRREHEGLLVEWVRSSLAIERGVLALEVASTLAGYGLAAWMLARHLGPGGEPGQALLLAFWALSIPMLGQQLALIGRQLPVQQNTARRLLEPLAAAEEDDPETAGGPLETGPRPGVSVCFSGVTVVAGGHTLLEDVGLDLPTGGHLAIVGASGAGKSTLVGVLLGWHVPAAGRVEIDGRVLDRRSLDGLRCTIAWVDPAVQLWNRPLLDNLAYGAGPEASGRVGEIREDAFLGPLLQALPEGLQSRLGEGGALVSGGEGQRVRLGRALLRPDARLVILDEPFRGLDRDSRRRLLERARRRWRGATLICITHDLEDTRGFDQVVVIDGGRVVESGPPRELAERPGSRYAAMLAEGEAVRRRLGEPGWRRLALEGGRLVEIPAGERGGGAG